jgi:hypothetical protein
MNSREVFTLLLNSTKLISNGGFVLDNSNNANVKFQVNFDALFQNRDKLYKRCQLRGQMVSLLVPPSQSIGAFGYLELQQLGTKNTLGLVALPVSQYISLGRLASSDSVFGHANNPFYNYLENLEGIELDEIPVGGKNFSIQYKNVLGNIQSGSDIGLYTLLLQFELFN